MSTVLPKLPILIAEIKDSGFLAPISLEGLRSMVYVALDEKESQELINIYEQSTRIVGLMSALVPPNRALCLPSNEAFPLVAGCKLRGINDELLEHDGHCLYFLRICTFTTENLLGKLSIRGQLVRTSKPFCTLPNLTHSLLELKASCYGVLI